MRPLSYLYGKYDSEVGGLLAQLGAKPRNRGGGGLLCVIPSLNHYQDPYCQSQPQTRTTKLYTKTSTLQSTDYIFKEQLLWFDKIRPISF